MIKKILKENVKTIYSDNQDYYMITTNDEKYIVGYMYAKHPRVAYTTTEFLILIPSEMVGDDIISDKFIYSYHRADTIENRLLYNSLRLWLLKDTKPLNDTSKFVPDSYEEINDQEKIGVKMIKYHKGFVRDIDVNVFD